MEKKYYLAYGSNLSIRQMRYRCPEARIIGKAYLMDWKLVFRFHADIEPCRGCRIPVLIWEITERDEKRLDIYEGYPVYYTKKKVDAVMMETGERLRAMVYMMAPKRKRPIPPSLDYYGIIEDGYRTFGFDLDILTKAMNESCR